MICDRIAASKIYYKKDYKNSTPYDDYMARKDNYQLNPKLKDFLEEVFYDLSKKGEKILNKKYIYNLYLKHIK